MRALVDTNVWLDVITGRESFCETSKAAILACINDEVEVEVVATSLKDIFYLISRYADAQKAYTSVESILSIASVASVDGLVCSQALELERPDYEDGLIAAAAMTERVDCIISRDAKAFESIAIPKYDPVEFLRSQGYEKIAF